ncbi:MAG: polysaccharide deacetylase family protein [bacterium]|nr:polysaccharide deacetylase family protein [bacterium]
MPGKLLMIWDYDSALGQINSQLPYNFTFAPIHREIENVEYILKTAKDSDINMTFACIGFAAEAGDPPFNIPEQIKRIFNQGHEIASHSWKHEWFPYLTESQIFKSLERSKLSLENCTGASGSVCGFVPPHSRPMSWYKKFAFSLGDRAFYPFHKGGDLGFVLKQLSLTNYTWCRVLKSYKPVWEKFSNSNSSDYSISEWEVHDNIVCVPQHHTGFDEPALKYLHLAMEKNEVAVIVGHPAALSRSGSESLEHYNNFIKEINKYKSEGVLETLTVRDYLSKYFRKGEKKN